MEKKENKFDNFYVYIFVGLGFSILLYMLVGDSISDRIEYVLGISGFLMAGAWSYLNIETNKEIKSRDEFLSFLKDYEDAVINYIDSCNEFSFTYRKIHQFILMRRLILSELSDIDSCGGKERLRIVKNDYGIEKISLLDEELAFKGSLCQSRFNVLLVKSRVLKCHVSEGELILEGDCISKRIIEGVSDTVCFSSKNWDSIELRMNSEDVLKLLDVLSKVLEEKGKSFDSRSGLYSYRLGVCMFFIAFGFFFCLWNLVGV